MAKHSTTRRLDLVSIPALSDEARDAVNAAFEAMSSWRSEAIENNEKSLEQVVEKMAVAARALGWPEQIVEATRSQMQSVTKAQIKLMDQMVDAWEEQIKSPNPSMMLSKLNSLSGFGPAGTWANAAGMSAMNPMQFYMQIFEEWQKAWSEAMAFWTKAAIPPGGARPLI
jgi:cob(I)alamin adenosyltransferase